MHLLPPQLDPAPIFEAFRGNYSMELLTAAVAHFGVFEHLATGPLAPAELKRKLRLGQRQFDVLITGLRALAFLEDQQGRLQPTPLAAEHLLPGQPLYVGDYIELAADSPGVLALVEH